MPAFASSRRPTSTRPARTTTGRPVFLGRPRDPGDGLAPQRLPVEGALAGEHQIDRRRPPGQPGRLDASWPRRRPARRRAAAGRTPGRRPRPHRAGPHRRRRSRLPRTASPSRAAPWSRGPRPSVPRSRARRRRTPSGARRRRSRPRASRPRHGHGPGRGRPGRCPPVLRHRDARTSPGYAPSAASMPAPPSELAVPPTPTTTRSQPRSIAASEQLPHAVRRRCAGVSAIRRDEVQPARVSGLDVRRADPALGADEQPGHDRVTGRAPHRHALEVATEGRGKDVEEAGTAVGERHQLELVARCRRQPTGPDGLGRLGRRSACRRTCPARRGCA